MGSPVVGPEVREWFKEDFMNRVKENMAAVEIVTAKVYLTTFLKLEMKN